MVIQTSQTHQKFIKKIQGHKSLMAVWKSDKKLLIFASLIYFSF